MLNTVNIVISVDNVITNIIAFKDDEKGNELANKTVSNILLCVEPELTDEELESVLDDGYYENINGYSLTIVHSCGKFIF